MMENFGNDFGPAGFSWVIPGQIAAMGRPSDPRKCLEFLKEQDIKVVVSLTTTPLRESLLEEFGFLHKHIPIMDFSAPTPEQVDEFVAYVRRAMRKRQRVVVHCGAGRGRTGTMLACYLVSCGRNAREAIEEIRRLRPGSIETPEQERAVVAYAARRDAHRKLKRKRHRH